MNPKILFSALFNSYLLAFNVYIQILQNFGRVICYLKKMSFFRILCLLLILEYEKKLIIMLDSITSYRICLFIHRTNQYSCSSFLCRFLSSLSHSFILLILCCIFSVQNSMRCEKHPANNKEKMLIGSVNILTYILIYLLHVVENICVYKRIEINMYMPCGKLWVALDENV